MAELRRDFVEDTKDVLRNHGTMLLALERRIERLEEHFHAFHDDVQDIIRTLKVENGTPSVLGRLRMIEDRLTLLQTTFDGFEETQEKSADWWWRIMGDLLKAFILLALGGLLAYYGIKAPLK